MASKQTKMSRTNRNSAEVRPARGFNVGTKSDHRSEHDISWGTKAIAKEVVLEGESFCFCFFIADHPSAIDENEGHWF